MLKFLFFTILFIVLFFFLTVGRLFFKLFFKNPFSNSRNFRSNAQRRGESTNYGAHTTNNTQSPNGGQKVFGQDEGEYVDFVEIEKDNNVE